MSSTQIEGVPNVDPRTIDLDSYVYLCLHSLGPGPVAKALGLSREAAMSVALGLASKGSIAVAQANLSALRSLMGDIAE